MLQEHRQRILQTIKSKMKNPADFLLPVNSHSIISATIEALLSPSPHIFIIQTWIWKMKMGMGEKKAYQKMKPSAGGILRSKESERMLFTRPTSASGLWLHLSAGHLPTSRKSNKKQLGWKWRRRGKYWRCFFYKERKDPYERDSSEDETFAKFCSF